MDTNKIVIVMLGALMLFCLGSARPALAAQPESPGKKKPPTPTTPVFELLDRNGNQVGTVVDFGGSGQTTLSGPGRVLTRISIQDLKGITHNLGLFVSPTNIGIGFGNLELLFEDFSCSGNAFLSVPSANAFLPAFEPYFIMPSRAFVIPASNVPEARLIRSHALFADTNGACFPFAPELRNVLPSEDVGNIDDMFPPPYTLIVK